MGETPPVWSMGSTVVWVVKCESRGKICVCAGAGETPLNDVRMRCPASGCVYVSAYVCTYVHMYTHAHTHTEWFEDDVSRWWMYVCMCICICTHIHTPNDVRITFPAGGCMYVYAYVYARAHTHPHTPISPALPEGTPDTKKKSQKSVPKYVNCEKIQ